MPEECGEKIPRTPDRLEEAFQEAREIGLEAALRGRTGGPLNAFLGTDELRNMGNHLLAHMRDEEIWDEPNKDFEPVDFVTAAAEVAYDNVAGKSVKTNVHIKERQPIKLTNIFVNFWLHYIALRAYGDEYANEVSSILRETR